MRQEGGDVNRERGGGFNREMLQRRHASPGRLAIRVHLNQPRSPVKDNRVNMAVTGLHIGGSRSMCVCVCARARVCVCAIFRTPPISSNYRPTKCCIIRFLFVYFARNEN